MPITAFCPICCEKYNKTLKTKVVCGIGTCNYSACKQCVRTYLTTTTQDPHCMKCKGAWDQSFLVKNLNRSFVTKDYAKHRQNLLLDKELSKLPATMECAAKHLELNKLQSKYNQIQNNIQKLNKLIQKHKRQQYDIRREMTSIRFPNKEAKEKKNLLCLVLF